MIKTPSESFLTGRLADGQGRELQPIAPGSVKTRLSRAPVEKEVRI